MLSWHQKLWRVIFIVFCFELGVFLLVFPWLDYWDNNSIAGLSPWLQELWLSPYFRGALSGLGLANLLISFGEVFRFRRPPEERMASVDRIKESSL
jgi:hypothetical protein